MGKSLKNRPTIGVLAIADRAYVLETGKITI